MKMSEIIDKVSEHYRYNLSRRKELQQEYNNITEKLSKADLDRGRNITYDEYNRLKARRTVLQQLVRETDQYLAGVSDVRELLMDFGFDTEVT